MKQLEMPNSDTIVVGHSMGGIVVAEVAQRCELQAAIMVGPVLPKDALGEVFNARINTVSKGQLLSSTHIHRTQTYTATEGMEAMAKVIPSAATGSNALPVSKAFIRSLLLSQSSEGYIGLCRAIAEATRPAYEECRCPLLIVAGEEDKTSPTADCQKIKDR